MFTQRESHVLEHIEVGKKRSELKHHAHTPTRCIKPSLVQRAHILKTVAPVQAHFAVLCALLPADQTQHGGLPPTRRTHQGADFAAWHRQREPVEHNPFAVTESDVAQFYQWWG